MINYLNMMQQSGIMQPASKTRAYQNALAAKSAEVGIRGQELSNLQKGLTMTGSALKNVKSKQDLKGALSFAGRVLPKEDFIEMARMFSDVETDEDAMELAQWYSMSTEQRLKHKNNQPASMLMRVGKGKDASWVSAELTDEQIKQYNNMNIPMVYGMAGQEGFAEKLHQSGLAATKAEAEAKRAPAKPEGPEKDPVFMKRINNLLDTNPGMTKQQATAIVENTKRLVVNPATRHQP